MVPDSQARSRTVALVGTVIATAVVAAMAQGILFTWFDGSFGDANVVLPWLGMVGLVLVAWAYVLRRPAPSQRAG